MVRWTQADDALLKELWVTDGLTAKAIAAQMGRTPAAVRQRAGLLGMRKSNRYKIAPDAVRVTIALAPDMHWHIVSSASSEGISMNAWIERKLST